MAVNTGRGLAGVGGALGFLGFALWKPEIVLGMVLVATLFLVCAMVFAILSGD